MINAEQPPPGEPEPEPSGERLRIINANDLRQDLENRLAKLLGAVRRLPPGPERHELLKEIGCFRLQIDAIIAEQNNQQSGK
jgi:hypothetical protein